MRTAEAALKESVKILLKQLNAYYYMPVPSGYGRQTLDFLCCIRGRWVAIETKAPGKRPTPRQFACMQEIERAGGVAIWGDSMRSIQETLALKGFSQVIVEKRGNGPHVNV